MENYAVPGTVKLGVHTWPSWLLESAFFYLGHFWVSSVNILCLLMFLIKLLCNKQFYMTVIFFKRIWGAPDGTGERALSFHVAIPESTLASFMGPLRPASCDSWALPYVTQKQKKKYYFKVSLQAYLQMVGPHKLWLDPGRGWTLCSPQQNWGELGGAQRFFRGGSLALDWGILQFWKLWHSQLSVLFCVLFPDESIWAITITDGFCLKWILWGQER